MGALPLYSLLYFTSQKQMLSNFVRYVEIGWGDRGVGRIDLPASPLSVITRLITQNKRKQNFIME